MRRRLTVWLGGLLLGGLVWLIWYSGKPISPSSLPAEFSIATGSSLKSVAVALAEQGLIEHPSSFVVLGRLLGMASQIKAGRYQLERAQSPYQLLRKITLGETALGKLMIVEGWTFSQMRAALDANARLRHDTDGMSDLAILAAIGAPEQHPEGLFFPDTYYFDFGESDLNIYKRAYQTLRSKLGAAWQGRAGGLPYGDPYQALIMASIVEKETGASNERPLIAAVFLNRLRLGMRLQTDPTVIYGLGERFDGNLRHNDLAKDTPYNTYTRGGLPPTPIALVGEAALAAALHPLHSRALYFVAKGDGQHHFSVTLEEHNRAVNRYQRGGGG